MHYYLLAILLGPVAPPSTKSELLPEPELETTFEVSPAPARYMVTEVASTLPSLPGYQQEYMRGHTAVIGPETTETPVEDWVTYSAVESDSSHTDEMHTTTATAAIRTSTENSLSTGSEMQQTSSNLEAIYEVPPALLPTGMVVVNNFVITKNSTYIKIVNFNKLILIKQGLIKLKNHQVL